MFFVLCAQFHQISCMHCTSAFQSLAFGLNLLPVAPFSTIPLAPHVHPLRTCSQSKLLQNPRHAHYSRFVFYGSFICILLSFSNHNIYFNHCTHYQR
jgi:hypothetical protein